MNSDFSFREVFNARVVTAFASDLRGVWPEFDSRGFTRMINPRLDALNYGARSELITDALARFLPPAFPDAVDVLLRALGPEIAEPELTGFDGFIIMPQCAYVARYGHGHFDVSMHALYEMTKRFSAEGAVRRFLRDQPRRTLALFAQWCDDPNPHVRRLVSEGTRPRLPLAARLRAFQDDPAPVLALLERLRRDPALYVRRSVANNLNDISRDNPDIVVETLRRWKEIPDEGTQWIIRHALRTLVKQGHPGALALLGYGDGAEVTVSGVRVDPDPVSIGSDARLSFSLRSTARDTQRLMIDFVLHYVKADGKRRPKVFKLAKKTLAPGERLQLEKSLSFRPMSTRRLYPGVHRVDIQINGRIYPGVSFTVS